MGFLPVTRAELDSLNIDALDFIVVSGDAYVDHPTFGHALIARIVEAEGFSVAVLPQPLTDNDYLRLGAPKKAFLLAGGVVDSMVNNYTVAKRRRSTDDYSENGRAGMRPDRNVTVYARALKRLFPDVPLLAGGIEASLRRLAHYDYWDDSVMRSILYDAPIDLLIYGMGENPLIEILEAARRNIPLGRLQNIRGTAYLTDINSAPEHIKSAIAGADDGYLMLSSYERVKSDKKLYAKAFMAAYQNTEPETAKGLIQKQDNEKYAVINPPPLPLTEKRMDYVHGLEFMREPHPMYESVPAIEEVKFSVTAHRGCYGNCAFCALTYHQGRRVSKRSADSIVAEVERLTLLDGFKGYIHDIGGPSANFHEPPCDKNASRGSCKNKDCIGFEMCANLKPDHSEYLSVLRRARKVTGVKKVFIRSGVRFDYLMADKDDSFLNELVEHHISGQLKVAPEHISDSVLKAMNKPPHAVYENFRARYEAVNRRLGKNQYLVPYFISSHPGCTLADAVKLTEYLMQIGYMPQQVQDFYPTPSTLSTTMYYTGLDPRTLEPVYCAKTAEEKAMQRALLQYRLPQNRALIEKALRLTGRTELLQRLVYNKNSSHLERRMEKTDNENRKPLKTDSNPQGDNRQSESQSTDSRTDSRTARKPRESSRAYNRNDQRANAKPDIKIEPRPKREPAPKCEFRREPEAGKKPRVQAEETVKTEAPAQTERPPREPRPQGDRPQRESRPQGEYRPQRESRPQGEYRPQRESRPQGDRPQRESRPQGEYRPQREPRPQGDRPQRESRPQGEYRPQREPRPQGDRPQRESRPQGEYRAQGDRPQRESRPQGEYRPQRESRPQGDRPQREPRPQGEYRPQRESRPQGEYRPQRESRPQGDRPQRESRPQGEYRKPERTDSRTEQLTQGRKPERRSSRGNQFPQSGGRRPAPKGNAGGKPSGFSGGKKGGGGSGSKRPR